jgi:hypothetical protein
MNQTGLGTLSLLRLSQKLLPAGTWHGHPARDPSMGGTPMPRAHLPDILAAGT